MGHMTRRDFIKVSGITVGGIILTGCGGGGGGGGGGDALLPSGYEFYELKRIGDVADVADSGFKINSFLYSTHISDNNVITFSAEDQNERWGIFQLGIDYDGSDPQILWERTALKSGALLDDGYTAERWQEYDVDENGNIAALINPDYTQDAEFFGTRLYYDEGLTQFQPLLTPGRTFGERRCTGHFSNVTISNSRIITTLNHAPVEGIRDTQRDSVLYLPDSQLNNSSLLVSTGDYLQSTNTQTKSFGLVALNSFGDYSMNIYGTSLLTAMENGSTMAAPASHIVKAHVNTPDDHQILTASPASDILGDYASGESFYGSRIDVNGSVYTLLGNSDDSVTMRKDDVELLTTGDQTDQGKILYIGPGSSGVDGLYYYVTRTDMYDAVLNIYDGTKHTPVLASGYQLYPGGPKVGQIYLGSTYRHIDKEGRIVFCCKYDNGVTALVVGIPS